MKLLANLPRIRIGRPQQLAGLLLLFFFCECLWVVHRENLSADDYRYARCGREMWEAPSPLTGYFTTCGNLNGDGIFAYRVAGLPLTLQRFTLQAIDHFRSPENKLYPGDSLKASTWDMRHQLVGVKYLIRVPFILFAVWIGGGLWWVSRRLFGNEGGFFALGLFCVCPAIVRFATRPNNEILALWGLYGIVYTSIGVAHAMQGPRRKWRPRIILLTIALGMTATAHLLAAMLGFVAATCFMFYLAERRRSYVMQILIYSGLGALFLVFASFAFHPSAFVYIFTGGSARLWFSLDAARFFFENLFDAPITIATAAALVLYLGVRRSRFFGNTVPLIVFLALLPLITTQISTEPWLWALPFLFTFLGGVFADALETRYRKLFLSFGGVVLVAQAILCFALLPTLGR